MNEHTNVITIWYRISDHQAVLTRPRFHPFDTLFHHKYCTLANFISSVCLQFISIHYYCNKKNPTFAKSILLSLIVYFSMYQYWCGKQIKCLINENDRSGLFSVTLWTNALRALVIGKHMLIHDIWTITINWTRIYIHDKCIWTSEWRQ